MENNVKQWVLLSALAVEVKLILLLWRYAAGFENLLIILENIVLLVIMGVSVSGIRRYSRNYWIFTIGLSAAGMLAELMTYQLFINYRIAFFNGSIADNIVSELGYLAGILLLTVGMSLLLYGSCLKKRKARLRTLGKRKWCLCIAVLAAVIGMSAWVVHCLGIYYENLTAQQPEDPLTIFAYFTAFSNNRIMVWLSDLIIAARRLVKAICIWVVTCGVLGFPRSESQERN